MFTEGIDVVGNGIVLWGIVNAEQRHGNFLADQPQCYSEHEPGEQRPGRARFEECAVHGPARRANCKMDESGTEFPVSDREFSTKQVPRRNRGSAAG